MWITSQTYFNSRADFRTECFMTKTHRGGSGGNQTNTAVLYFETVSVLARWRRLGHSLRHWNPISPTAYLSEIFLLSLWLCSAALSHTMQGERRVKNSKYQRLLTLGKVDKASLFWERMRLAQRMCRLPFHLPQKGAWVTVNPGTTRTIIHSPALETSFCLGLRVFWKQFTKGKKQTTKKQQQNPTLKSA